MKSPGFHIPKAWKRYPFQAEPPRVVDYREYPPDPNIHLIIDISKLRDQLTVIFVNCVPEIIGIMENLRE